MRVGADFHGGGMIGQHKHLEILPGLLQVLEYRRQNQLVDLFDGFYFHVPFTAVAAFVGRFHVYVDQIVAATECINRRFRLACIVGGIVAGGTVHVDDFHIGAKSDTLDQIYRRNDSTVNTPFFLEGGKSRLGAGAPQPGGVGGTQTATAAILIHRMVIENLIAPFHKLQESGSAVVFLGKIVLDLPSDNIVGTLKVVFGIRILPNEAVTVADTGMQDPAFHRQRLIQSAHQLIGLSGRNLVSTVIHHRLFLIGKIVVGNGNHVATDGRVITLQFDTHADSLQRRSATGINGGIVGKDCQIGGVAFRYHVSGYVHSRTCHGDFSQSVHVGLVGSLHRRLAVQLRNGAVSHTVRDQYEVFHHSVPPGFAGCNL